MLNYKRLVAAAIVACCAWATPAFAVRPGFLLFIDPGKRFSVEFPKGWHWVMVAGSGEAIHTFVEPNSKAAVVVEHSRLSQPLAQEEITDVFAQIEIDLLKEHQPGAANFVPKIVTLSGRRLIVIDYSRPGLGADEAVRQYSYPVGQDLYRVTCMTIMGQFAKYEAAFGSVAESLKPGSELSKSPPEEQ